MSLIIRSQLCLQDNVRYVCNLENLSDVWPKSVGVLT
jgi:hypothetical protein